MPTLTLLYCRFTEEIAPVAMKTKKGVVELSVDEHPRPDVTPAGMAKLPPVFKKNGTVTAANASGFLKFKLYVRDQIVWVLYCFHQSINYK